MERAVGGLGPFCFSSLYLGGLSRNGPQVTALGGLWRELLEAALFNRGAS